MASRCPSPGASSPIATASADRSSSASLVCDRGKHVLQQVREAGEAEWQLGLDATRRQDRQPLRLLRLDRYAPEHRLPDPGLASDDHGARAVGGLRHELEHPDELVFTANEVSVRCDSQRR